MTELDGLLHINKSYGEILGYTEEELAWEDTLTDNTHPEDKQKTTEY